MRIASISDLHVDHADNRRALLSIAGRIHEAKTDLLIVAGDVSHVDSLIESTLLALRPVAGVVAYIPGNHDLWSSVPEPRARPEINTWQRYRQDLRQIVERTGTHYLPAAPLVLGNVAVVGTCGWYDYSFAEDWVRNEIGLAAIAEKRLGLMAWLDGARIAFRAGDGTLMDDPAVAQMMEAELAAQLAEVGQRSDVDHVVAVTHHQPFREVVHRSGTLPWEYFCSFMGSEGLGRTILAAPKVRVAIHGHSHVIGEQQIRGLRVYGTALGYPRERRGMEETGLLETRIGWVELGASL